MKTKKIFFRLAMGIVAFLPSFSISQNLIWAKAIGGTDFEEGRSIVTDGNGNVYTTGAFRGTVDFDPGIGTFTITSLGAGSSDIFISKLDAAGNFIWARRIGSVADDAGNSITIDASGNIFSTGFFSGGADFDPGVGVYNLSASSWGGAYLLKLDAGGNFVWASTISTIGHGASISLDGLGNVYTTGYFDAVSDFDPSSGTYTLSAGSSGYDVFISKVDALGNFVWAKSIGGTGWDFGSSIAIDPSGNVITTGYFELTVDFDPGIGTNTLTCAGNYDIFISKLDASGNFIWAKRIGASQADLGISVTLDPIGNIFAAGRYNGTTDFDPDTGVFNLTSAGDDVFILKLDNAGNFVWAKSFGGTGFDMGYSLVTDAFGNVFATGLYSGTVDFDPGVGVNYLTSVGANDIFVSKLDPTGYFVWARGMGGTGVDNGLSITLDVNGNILITGHFQVTCDFDPSAGTYNLNSNGWDDIFIHKMNNVTGIAEFYLGDFIKIYPNPNNGSFKLLIDKEIENGELILFNSLGQKVFDQKITKGENKIITDGLSKGLYYYTLLQNYNLVLSGKIIVD